MGIKQIVWIFVSCLLLSILVSATSPYESGRKPKNEQKVQPKAITSLGSVDGKSYFYDNIELNAKEHCESSGLEMATITSENQLAFLKQSFNSTGFRLWYWTAARESRELRMLTWNITDESELMPSLGLGQLLIDYAEPDPFVCMVYYVLGPWQELHLVDCLLDYNVRVLCESRSD